VKKIATTYKQLLAGCLLAVFLLITGIKLLHSHHAFDVSDYSACTEKFEKKADCPVCDYHFTKDAHFDSLSFTLKKLHPLAISYSFFQSTTTSSIGLSYSDRGPPALC
jgi:hypothetical protein